MQKRIREGAPSRVHFVDAAKKKTLLSTEVLDICTRAGPKTLPKKVQQKLERGRGGEPLPAAWALKIDGF